jgi:hypothetical protein
MTAHVAMVDLATEVRNALFRSRLSGAIVTDDHHRAMLVCARHWKEANPIGSTDLSSLVAQVSTAAAAATTPAARRRASELAGVAGLLREVSGLVGSDLGQLHILATPIAATAYRESRAVDGTIQYLECGAAYNVNVVVKIIIPGVAAPMIVVCEAKGGNSAYGRVTVPRSLQNVLGTAVVSQRDKAYALTRAYYMRRTDRNDGVGAARREAGNMIQNADRAGVLSYVAARGKMKSGSLFSSLEVLI